MGLPLETAVERRVGSNPSPSHFTNMEGWRNGRRGGMFTLLITCSFLLNSENQEP